MNVEWILWFVGGLQLGLGLGGYAVWRWLRSRARDDMAVELLRPLVGALVAQSSGEIGPASLAVQQLTRRAATEASTLQLRESLKHVEPPPEPPRRGAILTRGGAGTPFGQGVIGRPSYDETENIHIEKPEGRSSGSQSPQ